MRPAGELVRRACYRGYCMALVRPPSSARNVLFTCTTSNVLRNVQGAKCGWEHGDGSRRLSDCSEPGRA